MWKGRLVLARLDCLAILEVLTVKALCALESMGVNSFCSNVTPIFTVVPCA